jgi:hypothetical protein
VKELIELEKRVLLIRSRARFLLMLCAFSAMAGNSSSVRQQTALLADLAIAEQLVVTSAAQVEMAQAYFADGASVSREPLYRLELRPVPNLRWRTSANKQPTYSSNCVPEYRCFCVCQFIILPLNPILPILAQHTHNECHLTICILLMMLKRSTQENMWK